MTEGVRPSHEEAEGAIADFLAAKIGACPPFHQCEDGDDGWAF